MSGVAEAETKLDWEEKAWGWLFWWLGRRAWPRGALLLSMDAA